MAASPHPFAFRDYRWYWLARFTSTIGQTAMVVVVAWQVYDIARRTMAPKEAAFQLGLIGAVQFFPLLLLTPIVGWAADRTDRRWIARSTLLLEALCAAVLMWVAWTGTTTLPTLFGVAALLGVARAFAGPALGALAPNLLPPAVLPAGIAMGSVAWQVGSIGGPALGGYLYAGGGWLAYAVALGLLLAAAAAMFLVGPVPRTAIGDDRPIRQMVEGLHYVRRNRMVLGSISLDLFAVLLGGATAMLPVYARDVLHVGATGLGNLRAAPAIGSAAMAIALGIWPLKRNVGVTMLGSVCLFGAATVVFGLSRSMALSLAALVVLGAADMISVFVRQSLIQLHTPNEMRGRVGAVSSLFISGSNELGEAESGLLAALLGAVPAVVLGGLGAIGVTLAWAWLFPELRRTKTFDPPIIIPQEEQRP